VIGCLKEPGEGIAVGCFDPKRKLGLDRGQHAVRRAAGQVSAA